MNYGERITNVLTMAHELGHALLHYSDEAMYFHKYTLTPPGRAEVDANKFAAELLINVEELDTHYIKEMTIGQLARYYRVPEQFIIYKFNL